MNAGHWVSLGGVTAVFVSLAGGGSLQPPPGPVGPTMTSLDTIYQALGGPAAPAGAAYVKIGDVVGDVTTPGLVGFIPVKSWTGHENFSLTIDPGRAAPALLQKWRTRERIDSIEMRVFDPQGMPTFIVTFTLARIETIATKGPPTVLDLTLNGRIDQGNSISWTHPASNTTFTYNPTTPP
jgi:hypothetical protein